MSAYPYDRSEGTHTFPEQGLGEGDPLYTEPANRPVFPKVSRKGNDQALRQTHPEQAVTDEEPLTPPESTTIGKDEAQEGVSPIGPAYARGVLESLDGPGGLGVRPNSDLPPSSIDRGVGESTRHFDNNANKGKPSQGQ